ncbi:MAG: hypothetical protein E3J64_09780 [Anaerolineales bacterium]|nr:MAG: hypothetical protein E3J64_09780 [Anaerolineales bacterium]
MELQVTLTSIPAASVVYNEETGLFVFSPRREIDRVLVEGLKRSMAETGVWQPIVVRARTMEGIAGNHRFLAQVELAKERGLNQGDVEIMAAVVDCDEGLAVTIALAENEIRQNLTEWEAVRALVAAAKVKPKAAEAVFEVDGKTVEQLRFWQDELNYEAEAEERRRELQSRLTRDWPGLVTSRLTDYPDLRLRPLTLIYRTGPRRSQNGTAGDVDECASKQRGIQQGDRALCLLAAAEDRSCSC